MRLPGDERYKYAFHLSLLVDSIATKTFLSFHNLFTLLHTLAPSGPPLNIKTTSRSVSSLSLTWDPPDKEKQHGVIVSYTACVALSKNGLCFQTFTTTEREWIVRKLNASTKYYIRVLATNKAGDSAYSESTGIFTNGSKCNIDVRNTECG